MNALKGQLDRVCDAIGVRPKQGTELGFAMLTAFVGMDEMLDRLALEANRPGFDVREFIGAQRVVINTQRVKAGLKPRVY